MKKIFEPGKELWKEIITRPTAPEEDIEPLIRQIFVEVEKNGNSAVQKFSEIYDGFSCENIFTSKEEIEKAVSNISSELKEAIFLAKENIEKFHSAQKTGKISVETSPGVDCWLDKKAIQRVGLYIPGGSAPLFSTVLMLAIPAKIAGCKEIILFSPPNRNGEIHPAILFAADLCGVTRIVKAGGIQAIAAMTFGTETIPKVDKIFGPGNQFVTAAKQMATKYQTAIDMPAGPSELMVIADDSAIPAFVASDLLSQAEHGNDSQVILLSDSEELILEVEKEIERQIFSLPRKKIAEASLKNAKLIFFKDEQKIIDLTNEYAPEHLIIASRKEDFYLEKLINAGSVFLGNYSPESAGDYASGTNHTLPTNGYAKQYSGINLDSFMKTISFQRISRDGIKNIGPAIEIMAEAEGLLAHKSAVSQRLNSL